MNKESRPTRVLIYGKDARSDALASSCAASIESHELFGYSEYSHPGFNRKCRNVGRGSLTDVKTMIRYADEVQPDLVIVGPEEPLAVGLVDALEERGYATFGPRKSLARLETSKSWTRKLVDKYKIPGNPQYRIFEDTVGLGAYLRELGEFVLKPDGLTGGKGVRVSGEHIHSVDQAMQYAIELLSRDKCFVVEDRLIGEEFSVQSITDGNHLIHCPAAQDHKRAFDGDFGPNTGGMGSYSCADHSLPFLAEEDVRTAQAINVAVADALSRETGAAFRGVLYGGFMLTAEGVKLLEYNARFADPEAMNVLPIFTGDFIELTRAVTDGTLHRVRGDFNHRATVCKYVVPKGYPDNPVRDVSIRLPSDLSETKDLQVYFAAVDERQDGIYLTGSRAIAFVGVGDTLEEAEALAEVGASSVEGPVSHRADIGTQQLVEARIEHMAQIRRLPLPARTSIRG